MNQAFLQIYELVWKEIFPNTAAISLDRFKQLFASDILLPQAYQSQLDGQQVYASSEYGYKGFVSPEATMKRTEADNYIEPKQQINSLWDVLNNSKNLFLFKGSRAVNSDLIEASDDIYSSSLIYNSTHLYSCQKILFSNNCIESEYLVASRNSKNCSFDIRAIDSGGSSNSFDISFVGKSANCYFCHDGYDLRDCMFCFHLASKQYCIANMQFEKDEYMSLKDKLLTEYIHQLDSAKPFLGLKDL